MTTRPLAADLSDRIAALGAVDQPAQLVAKQVRSLLKPGAVKDAISGTWLGHALHPLLTDVVIGSWTSATLLDLLGGRDGRRAAERLIAIGIAAYGPTALSGASDWADSELGSDAVRRIGLVHALTNASALGLYGASLAARRQGRHGRGVLLGLAGAGAMSAGGWLGGDLSYARGVGVDQTAFDAAAADWTPAIDEDALGEGVPAHATVDGVGILLVRRGGRIHALADRCAHRGGALHDGELVGDCIECPLHGTRFRLEDGSVERGPSTYPQPRYEARTRQGRVEVRAAS